MQPRLYQRVQAAFAARIDPATLSQWIKRGHPILSETRGDVGGSGPGVRRLFSEETIVQVAIAARLVDRGSAIEEALVAALGFFISRGDREPGRPFRSGDTLMFAVGRTSWTVNVGAHRPLDGIEAFFDEAADLGDVFHSGLTGVTMVNVGAVYRDVNARLTPNRRADVG